MAVRRITDKNKKIATILAYSVVPLSGLVTDIYLPSMPHMAIDLNVPESTIQLTLSFFLISYGITQILAGSILDALGRYRITLLALLLFSLSSLAIAVSNNIHVILTMRAVQGVCAGFAVVGKRVFFVDVYEGQKQRSLLSSMTIIWAAAPIIAPFIGGYLETYFTWRSNFYVLAIYGFILIILEGLFSGETIKKTHPLRLKSTLSVYFKMFKTADFALGIGMTGISYGMVMMYSMSGPFIIEHEMGYAPVITGYISLLLGIAWMCGGFLSKSMLDYKTHHKSYSALSFQLLIAMVMIIAGWYGQSLLSLSITAFMIHVAAGFIFNIFFTYCLSRFPEYAGISNGITGGGTYFLTSFLSYGSIAIFQPIHEQLLGQGYLSFAAVGLIAFSLWLTSAKKSRITSSNIGNK
ncbi:MFS transporter [Fulvivirga sediminis]|uniref:MFS transporter n=1 Tax=Fulvivirga sediminis TaxID=2803949 RepID=A0A937F3S3_9BACT|nr:MFS transporter [Fulvivirga sediminis]MBL3655175.1 MFS transporter [Fulvivirga sediminis]